MYEIMAFSKKSAHTVAMTMDKANGRKPNMHRPCTTHTVWEIIDYISKWQHALIRNNSVLSNNIILIHSLQEWSEKSIALYIELLQFSRCVLTKWYLLF